MIQSDVQTEILSRLKATEESKQVRILMAIESGSRAWGFASPNSDYDVRFIYVHEKDWYVDVGFEEKRDVIEYDITDDIDLNGWDVRKSLRLFSKSNPAFVEWIQSPITYIEKGIFRQKVVNLLPEVYSTDKGIYHYRSMAKTNYRGYLRSDLVPLKKYFYVLRPLLSIKWLEEYKTPAPIEFHRLLALTQDQALLDAIDELLEKKKSAKEMELSPAVPILNDFIETELGRLEKFKANEKSSKSSARLLNELFHQILGA